MQIQLKQFGETLSSREAGKEAYTGFLSTLAALGSTEIIEIDFTGLSSLSPSWGDEFLSPLAKKLGDHLILLQTQNLSANATLDLLEDIHGIKFNRIS